MRRTQLASYGLMISLLALPAAASAQDMGVSQITPLMGPTVTAVPLSGPNPSPAVSNSFNGQTQANLGQPLTSDSVADRDISQQQQIEQGLKSGQLTDAEASRLERDEARIDHQEARDLQNGSLSPSESARLNAAFDAQGNRITTLENNAATGSPSSPSSQRLQADVQRNINQEQRIDRGIDNGNLTATEVGALESGQAGVDAQEASAARNGFVGTNEQQSIQAAENNQSVDIKNANANNSVALTGSTSTSLNSPVVTSVSAANNGVSTSSNTTASTLAAANAGIGVSSPTVAAANAGIGAPNAVPVQQQSMARVGMAPAITTAAHVGRH